MLSVQLFTGCRVYSHWKGILMVNPGEWAQWYYLIYLLPGGVALLLLLLSALGGGMRHGSPCRSRASQPGAWASRGTAHHGACGRRTATPCRGRTVRRGCRPFSAWGAFPRRWSGAAPCWAGGCSGSGERSSGRRCCIFPPRSPCPRWRRRWPGRLSTEKVTVEAAARLLPRDESYATSAVDLCGLTGNRRLSRRRRAGPGACL